VAIVTSGHEEPSDRSTTVLWMPGGIKRRALPEPSRDEEV